MILRHPKDLGWGVTIKLSNELWEVFGWPKEDGPAVIVPIRRIGSVSEQFERTVRLMPEDLVEIIL